MTLARRLNLVVLALAPVSVALAQPKPALVQDRDEAGRAPYVEAIQTTASTKCSAIACGYDLTVVPAGKRLVISHVAVTVAQTVANSTAFAYLMRNGGDIVPLGIMQQAGGRYVLSMPVTYYVEAGQTPRIELATDSVDLTKFFGAALIGHFVALP